MFKYLLNFTYDADKYGNFLLITITVLFWQKQLTRVGVFKIPMTTLNSATPKTPCLVQDFWPHLSHKPSYS